MEPSLFRYIWKNNRGDHAIILAITLVSLPFYLLSLDLPKRIINEAIVGSAFEDGKLTANFWPDVIRLPAFLGGNIMFDVPDWPLERGNYLYALSALFLVLALVNVAFRFVIDERKGALGERLVRRLRFDLFARFLRFPPESSRSLRGSDAASVIVDEVSYLGSFFIDGSPTALILRMLTALFFMLSQNVPLGLLAAAMVASQGVLVPWLRREQVRLTGERSLEQRALGNYVRGIVDHIGVVRGHGAMEFEKAAIGARLGGLFSIRFELFRRRLVMTMLNLALVESTPFLFYAFGGYLALPDRLGGAGAIDVGQLVAIIAAYRDLPEPVRALVDWDQRRLEMQVRYELICRQVSPEGLLRDAAPAVARPASGGLEIQNLKITDAFGPVLLDGVTLSLTLPVHAALTGGPGDGHDALAKLIGRQLTTYSGTVTLNGANFAEGAASSRIAYMGETAALFEGTIRDNILYGLKQRRHAPPGDGMSHAGAARRLEARKSGNPLATPDDGWIDYDAAGAAGADDIDARIIHVLQAIGFDEDIYRFGLSNKIDPAHYPDLAARIIDARKSVHDALGEDGASGLIEPFDPARYHANSTIGENLLFGVPLDDTFDAQHLSRQGFVRQMLRQQGLDRPLIAMGAQIAATMAEIFEGVPPGHTMFDRFSFIAPGDLPDFEAMLRRGESARSAEDRSRLLALALAYCEPRHRLGLLDADMESAIVRARTRFMTDLPGDQRRAIAFYNPGQFCAAAPIRDNLLFGRVTHARAGAQDAVTETIRGVLRDMGLDGDIYSAGLDLPVVEGGRLLSGPQRAAIDLSRCLIKQPDILVLDEALQAFGRRESADILARVRAAQVGRSVLLVAGDHESVETFEIVLVFRNGRLAQAPASGEAAIGAGTSGQHGLSSLV